MKKNIYLEIKQALGLRSVTTVYRWQYGDNPVSADMARRLEALTGISRDRFLYPDEFGNPWPDVKALSSLNDTQHIERSR